MMSKRLVTLTVAVFVLLLPAFVSADLTSSLVAYYPFNGNANDESGNGNNGTVYGATLTSDRFGNPDSAYSFDGLDDYIEVPNADSLNPAAVTISAWFNIYSYGSPGWCNFPTLIFKQSPKDVDNTYYAIALMNDYPGWTVGCLSSSTWSVSGPNAYVASLQPLPLGEWHHVVATINSTEVREYIDGQLQGVSSTGFPLDPGSRPLYIGYTGMFCGAYWNGLIDEVRIYNRTLTEAEIQKLYGGSPGINDFTICQVQHNGDYDPDPGSLGNLVAEIVKRTGNNEIFYGGFVTLDSVPSCNMLYITGHYGFSFTETQRANLKTYLENGGLIFADDCAHYLDNSGFESSFRAEIQTVLGQDLEVLPSDHAVFSSFYTLSGTLPTTWNNEPLEGINIGDRTAIIYSDNDYGCAWEGDVTCDSACRENSFEMGINIALYGFSFYNPAYGNLEVSPSSHDFGEVLVGQMPILQGFILNNTGDAEINISNIYLSDSTDLALDTSGVIYPCSINNQMLEPGDLCTILVKYSPSQIGTINSNLIIESNDPDTPVMEIPLRAVAKCNPIFLFSVINNTFNLFEGITGVPDSNIDDCKTTVDIDIQYKQPFPINFWVSIDQIDFDSSAVEKVEKSNIYAQNDLIAPGGYASFKTVFRKEGQITFTLSLTNPKARAFTYADIFISILSPIPVGISDMNGYINDIRKIPLIEDSFKHFNNAIDAALNLQLKEADKEMKLANKCIKGLKFDDLLLLADAYLKLNIKVGVKGLTKALSGIPSTFFKIIEDLIVMRYNNFNPDIPMQIILKAD